MQPLAGLSVLDLTQIYNGPYATFLLAAAGAEVIKVEPPGGEHLRKRSGSAASTLPYAMLNAGKLSVRLDLKTEEGRTILARLADKADILVENFAPGVMERLGLGAAALQARNPRLIYASSSGYGSDGPYRDYPAMDLTVQAMSGIMASTGFPDQPPVKAGPAICDFTSGIHLYAAITTALVERARTGRGRVVEVSMMEAIYFSLSSNLGMLHAQGDAAPQRTGNRHGGLSLCPYNVYPAADGHIAIIVNHETHWRSLLTAFGRTDILDGPRWRTNAERVAEMNEVDSLVASFTRDLPRQEAFERLVAHRVPCAPVRSLDEVMHDPHLHARGMLRPIDHPQYGPMIAAGSPLRFDGIANDPGRPSVPLGTDTRSVLGQRLGLSEAELDRMETERII
ncbi:CoA transferase [Roseomonas sp. CAU 1739]|uniref:CaiB/BaiF CoA transferase family protein n=1 Tax=Roseomonas sp. CAU 1739 TaxID=3140364 RepID=UPI00325B4583